MRIALTMLCVVVMLQTSAQEKKPHPKIQYKTIVQACLVTGSTTESAALQLIGGVKTDRFFAGIGTGLDFYMYRGIPLFSTIRYDLLQKNGSLFMYADGGIHFPWVKGDAKDDNLKYFSGFYSDAGFGYQFKSKTTAAFLLSVGYSYKHVKQQTASFWFNPWPIEPANQFEIRNYHLNRISIKLGVMF
jgi:hypothetical protein